MMRIGSLFSGYGGLDEGVQDALANFAEEASVAWYVEFDKAPAKVLAYHYPDIPNYGDIREVDWSQVEPVDILVGGFPCQDVSLAGTRAGLAEGTRSGLWFEYARAIKELKPKYVVIENVRGLLSAKADSGMEYTEEMLAEANGKPILTAIAAVCGDLADLGYDALWKTVRASDAGAAHRRERVFILAYPRGA